MALNTALIGREYGPSEVYEVGREHIRKFAQAIGDSNPAYTDPEAAKAHGHPDVIAPPTFLITLTFRFADQSPVVDPELGLDYSRVVHGEQGFRMHRAVRAGDRLVATTRVEDIRSAGSNEFLTSVTEVTDAGGEPVATLTSTIVSRGTARSTDAAAAAGEG